jgi:hypothetical protein
VLPSAQAASQAGRNGSPDAQAVTNVRGLLGGASATSATIAWAVGSHRSGKWQTTVSWVLRNAMQVRPDTKVRRAQNSHMCTSAMGAAGRLHEVQIESLLFVN